MNTPHYARNYLAQFFGASRVLRAPSFVALFAFVVLSLPLQTREVYRVLADDFPNQRWQVALGFIGLLVASGFIWHCGRRATLIQRPHALMQSSFEGVLLRWLPRVLAALIPLGAALGLYRAVGEAQTTAHLLKSITDTHWFKPPELDEVHKLIVASPTRLTIAVLLCLGLVAVVLLSTVLRTRHKNWKYERPSRWLMGREVTIACLGIAAISVVMFSVGPPELAQSLGAVAVFALFVVVFVVVTTFLTVFGDRIGIPILTCLLAWGILLGVIDKNDDHTVELTTYDHKKNETGPYKAAFRLKDAFKNWYETRQDRDQYNATKGDPYPVFIVAAAGGGAYAAHYTATFLARLQDRCPSFAQHTFAISGVSGGSLGATVFAALAKRMAKNGGYTECNFAQGSEPGPFEQKVQEIFSADFLSPVLAAGLFPDLLQRLLPRAVPTFDRAKALDATLEAAWRRAMESDKSNSGKATRASPLENSFLALWSLERPDEAVPALVLNATEVANGYRTFISPLYIGELPKPIWSKAENLNEAIYGESIRRTFDTLDPLDIRLSTAAGISARFPYILPAASIRLDPPGGGNGKIRLVDGGYVESSAVATANDMIQVLKGNYRTLRDDDTKPDPQPKFKFYLLVLMGYEGQEAEERSLGETSVPLQSLISTWGSRADQMFIQAYVQNCFRIDRCFDTLDGSARAPVETDVAAVFLNLRDFHIPLTWQLTEASRRIISLHAGVAGRCMRGRTLMLGWTDISVTPGSETEERDRMRRIVHALQENDCSACLLQYKLAKRSMFPDRDSNDLCSEPTTTASTPR